MSYHESSHAEVYTEQILSVLLICNQKKKLLSLHIHYI